MLVAAGSADNITTAVATPFVAKLPRKPYLFAAVLLGGRYGIIPKLLKVTTSTTRKSHSQIKVLNR